MNGYRLVQMTREHAERLRRESRQMGITQEDIDAHKHKPIDLGGQMHIAWLKMRMASEIDAVANSLEAECGREKTPPPVAEE